MKVNREQWGAMLSDFVLWTCFQVTQNEEGGTLAGFGNFAIRSWPQQEGRPLGMFGVFQRIGLIIQRYSQLTTRRSQLLLVC